MIRINLLPFRAARKKENIRRQVSLFLLSLVLVCICLFVIHQRLGAKVKSLNHKAETLKQQLKSKRKAAKEVDAIKKALAALQQKLDAIKWLEQNRREPVRLLEGMTEMLIPQRMWLTDLASDLVTVTLKGVALDQKTVADFMIQLEGSGLFSSVNLSTIRQTEMQGINVKSFEISCAKVDPPGREEKKK
jgi:type IV pilus assembly protein PilN